MRRRRGNGTGRKCGFVFLLLCAAAFSSLVQGADPNSPASILKEPDYQKAAGLFFQGDTENARRLLTKLGADRPDAPPVDQLMAALYTWQGDRAGFFRTCAEAVEANPDEPGGWYLLAERAIAEERYIEAGLLLQKGDEVLGRLSTNPDSVSEKPGRMTYLANESLSLAMRLATGRQNFAKAEEAARKLAQRSPENDAVLLSLGWILLEQGKTDEAIGVFDQAWGLNPDNLPGWLIASELLDRAGKMQEAQTLADSRFSAQSPDTESESLPQIIRLYFKWNRLSDAETLIQKLPENWPEKNLLAGRLALCRGKYLDAEKEYRTAQTFRPDDFEIRNGYALALAEINEGKRNQAMKLAEQNYEENPDSEEAAATLAWVEFLSGNTDTAQERLQPILDSGSFTPTTAYYMAEIALAQENETLCLTLLELALGQEGFFPKREEAAKLKAALEKEEPQ